MARAAGADQDAGGFATSTRATREITDDALAAVMRGVGEELGNTAAVARASHVSPVVVDHYLAGRTLSDYRSSSGAAPKHLAVAEHALMEMLEDTAG